MTKLGTKETIEKFVSRKNAIEERMDIISDAIRTAESLLSTLPGASALEPFKLVASEDETEFGSKRCFLSIKRSEENKNNYLWFETIDADSGNCSFSRRLIESPVLTRVLAYNHLEQFIENAISEIEKELGLKNNG